MKAIILVSSIFYILGLKISNKIDLLKKDIHPSHSITEIVKEKPEQKASDQKEDAVIETPVDTMKSGGSADSKALAAE